MDYGELQSTITAYLYDRQDLVNTIPSFIQLAERRMFRVLRVPANEAIITYPAHDSASVQLPANFLEAKLVTAGGVPIQRISDTAYLKSVAARSAAGVPRSFCRIGAELHLFPVPDDAFDVSIVYWADLSGQLQGDNDTHEILRTAPDLYLHGALIEASAYLGQDPRIATWAQLYQSEMAQVQTQAAEAEYAGSTTQMSNVYPDESGSY